MPEISCIPKYLPSELLMPAAATAALQNPANRPLTNGVGAQHSVLSPEHIAVLTSKWWSSKGVHLTVGFMESTPQDLQARIVAHMNEWGKYANVSFVLTTTDPQVRITRALSGYWSYLGTDILHIAKNEATLCLEGFTMATPESEFRRVVRHETGHTLGCVHEHMRSAIVNRIDVQKAIAYFRQTQGWSPAMVMSQVLTPLAESSLMGTPDADETSIMAYNLPGIITKDGRPIIGGDDIAPQDIEFIGKIYPKQSAPPPPPLPAVSLAGITVVVDPDKKTIGFSAPAGWTAQKISKQGAPIMDAQCAVSYADELEAAIPVATAVPAESQAALGGVLGAATKLVMALRSQDWAAAYKALLELLTLLGPKDEDASITFGAQAALFGFDKGKLVAILLKILPLLLA